MSITLPYERIFWYNGDSNQEIRHEEIREPVIGESGSRMFPDSLITDSLIPQPEEPP